MDFYLVTLLLFKSVMIGCPDRLPGCLVIHYEKRTFVEKKLCLNELDARNLCEERDVKGCTVREISLLEIESILNEGAQ